jgi:hypothetical protein
LVVAVNVTLEEPQAVGVTGNAEPVADLDRAGRALSGRYLNQETVEAIGRLHGTL